jgi:lipopolysaccharide/colanic/teichoic acid biosynthesis glycosyltransferase
MQPPFYLKALLKALMLPPASPLLAALAVLTESRGAVIYRRERTGLGGKPLTVLKFRSRVNDAEKNGAAQWAGVNDSGVTAVGRFNAERETARATYYAWRRGVALSRGRVLR